MTTKNLAPRRLSRWQSFLYFKGLRNNPLMTLRQLHDTYGPNVELQYPHSLGQRPKLLGCIADNELYRTIFSDPETWRTANIGFRGVRGTAARRLAASVPRYQGARHAHYRRLMVPPLSRSTVMTMSTDMATIAKEHASSWQRGVAVDLRSMANHLMQDLATGLLFNGDRERSRPIAKLIEHHVATAWPGNFLKRLRWLPMAAKQERLIMEWAELKRGKLDPRDLLSVIVNSPTEKGRPADREVIGGFLTFTFGAAYETCQNAMIWTLVLLTQHPQIAAALTDEVRGAVGDGLPTMDRIDSLPLLHGVINEGMRLFPPVPIQFRKTTRDTILAGAPVKDRTRYLASAFLINRDPDNYPFPNQFRPERWRSAKQPSPYDYTVFGAGNRMCPGFTFAEQMVKTALAAILSQHRVDMAPAASVDYHVSITLTPQSTVPIVLRDLAAAPAGTRIAGRFRELVELPDTVQGLSVA